MNPFSDSQDSLHAYVTNDVWRGTTIESNICQNVVIVTQDKLKLCLIEHCDRLKSRDNWITPASLLAAFLTTLCTSQFKDWIVPANTWQAIFILATVGSVIWLCCALFFRRSSCSIDDLIIKIKRNDGVGGPVSETIRPAWPGRSRKWGRSDSFGPSNRGRPDE